MSSPAFTVRGDERSVAFWSVCRLPFEPTGPMLEARTHLRAAIRGLRPEPGRALVASYSSLDSHFFDVENVLYYNVGPAAFGALASSAIRFERQRRPPPVSPCGRSLPHHHQYCVAEIQEARMEMPGCSLEFPLPVVTSDLKTDQVWWEASRAVSTGVGRISGPFELQVLLQLVKPVSNLTSVMKPLLDGLVSAMHIDRKLLPEGITRLSAKTGRDAREIRERLAAPTVPLLGRRDLLRTSSKGVSWNPADELLEVCLIEQRAGTKNLCRVHVW